MLGSDGFAVGIRILTEAQEQSVHRHRVDRKEHRANQIGANHHNDCRNEYVVESNLINVAAQIKEGNRSHAQGDQQFRHEKQETCDLMDTKSICLNYKINI